ncbi:MAG: hypothetical protein AAGB29_12225 [Planctomycetota bacterium]
MQATGRCPECGASVEWSLAGDLLSFADPGWIDRVRQGLKLFVILAAAYIPASFLMVLLMVVAEAVASGLGVAVVVLFVIAILVVVIAALLRVTTPEPGAAEPAYSARRLARWGFLGAMAGYPVMLVGLFPLAVYGELFGLIWVLGVGLAIMVLGTTGFIAMFCYGRRLALRMPKPWLAKQTMFCLWSIVGAYGLLFVMGVLAGLFGAVNPASGVLEIVSGVISCAGSALILGLFVWAFVLLCIYLAQISRITKEAYGNAVG